jgi:hypothetical protein
MRMCAVPPRPTCRSVVILGEKLHARSRVEKTKTDFFLSFQEDLNFSLRKKNLLANCNWNTVSPDSNHTGGRNGPKEGNILLTLFF